MEEKSIIIYCKQVQIVTINGALRMDNVEFITLYNIANYKDAILKIYITDQVRPININYSTITTMYYN